MTSSTITIKGLRPSLSGPGGSALVLALGIALSLGISVAALMTERLEFLVAIAAIPLALALASLRPFLLCLAFICFSFFRLHEAIPVLHPLRVPEALGALTLLSLIIHAQQLKRSVSWPPELAMFAVFFALVTIGLPFSDNRVVAFEYWSDSFVKIAAITVAASWLMNGRADAVLAVRVFLLCGFFLGCVAIYNKLNGIDLVGGSRVTIGHAMGSPIGDPNDLALTLMLPLGFAGAILARAAPLWDRLLAIATISVIVIAIYFTESRGGTLGTAAVFLPLLFRRITWKSILVVACLLAVVYLIGSSLFAGRAGDEMVMSSDDRLRAWGAAIRMAIFNPIGGVGLGNFGDNLYFYVERWDGFRDMVAHSTWFTVLAETGLPGFAVFIAMIYQMMRSARRSLIIFEARSNMGPIASAMPLGVIASLTGFCVAGSFLTQAYTWQIYILLALTIATRRLADALTGASARTDRSAARKRYRKARLW